MRFKENLIQKIQIDRLADAVIRSVTDGSETGKFDKTSMEKLLEFGGFTHIRERDLDLYILADKLAKKRILVLDNGLAVYETTVEDVVLRKSPTVKEMVSFRNAFRILNDSDVLVSKRADSVRAVQKSSIDRLDLSYTPQDIEAIAHEGIVALEGKDQPAILETLTLFTELLQLKPSPKAFRLPNLVVLGWEETFGSGGKRFGPMIIFDTDRTHLYLIEEAISTQDTERMHYYSDVASGREKASLEGTHIFRYLADKVTHREAIS
jgi:hypothetical protein